MYQVQQKSTSYISFVIGAVCLVIAITFYALLLSQSPLVASSVVTNMTLVEMQEAYLIEVEITGTHAVDKHGQAAIDIRSCVSSGNIYKTLKHKFDDKFALLCEVPLGWGIQICVKTDDGLAECTSFVPKDGTWDRVIRYLSRDWTTYTGPLP